MTTPEKKVSEHVLENMEAIEAAANAEDIFAAVIIGNPDTGHMLVYVNSKSNTAQTVAVLYQILEKMEATLAQN